MAQMVEMADENRTGHASCDPVLSPLAERGGETVACRKAGLCCVPLGAMLQVRFRLGHTVLLVCNFDFGWRCLVCAKNSQGSHSTPPE